MQYTPACSFNKRSQTNEKTEEIYIKYIKLDPYSRTVKPESLPLID